MNLSHRSAIAAIALAAVCVVGIIVLTALHTPVPSILPQLALGAAFAGAGIASPLTGSTAAATVNAGDAAAVTVSTSSPDVPTPSPYTAPPGG